MSVIKFTYRLQFNNNLPKTNKICFVDLLQLNAVILNSYFFLAFIRNVSSLKLYFKSLLINCFQKPMSKMVIYMKSSTNDIITLFLIDNHCITIFVLFVQFVFNSSQRFSQYHEIASARPLSKSYSG